MEAVLSSVEQAAMANGVAQGEDPFVCEKNSDRVLPTVMVKHSRLDELCGKPRAGVETQLASKGASFTKQDLQCMDSQLSKHIDRLCSFTTPRARPDPHILPPEWEIDPRELTVNGLIAKGTYGVVHHGVYKDQKVAVKLLDWGTGSDHVPGNGKKVQDMFKREVAVWKELDHSNITKFFGACMGCKGLVIPRASGDVFGGREGGRVVLGEAVCCLVVEYVAGGTLKSFLIRHRKSKLPLATVLQLALNVARGLAYLHSRKIVHRDVKSENMLVEEDRTVKIADFGVARKEAFDHKGMTGNTGTVGYMAPEVVLGRPYDHKCDVFSFGIMLWEIYVCNMPFLDLKIMEIAEGIVHKGLRPEIPRCCPKALAVVMEKSWDQDPSRRPEMEDIVTMLSAINPKKGGGMLPDDHAPPMGCFCLQPRGP